MLDVKFSGIAQSIRYEAKNLEKIGVTAGATVFWFYFRIWQAAKKVILRTADCGETGKSAFRF